MRNTITVALAVALTTLTAGSAQEKPTPKPATKSAPTPAKTPTTQKDADKAVRGAGKVREGWKGRLDSPEAKMESCGVANEGPTMKFTTGPDAAGICYKPNMKAKDNYEVSASFSQLKPSQHPETYGLFIGGTDLDK